MQNSNLLKRIDKIYKMLPTKKTEIPLSEAEITSAIESYNTTNRKNVTIEEFAQKVSMLKNNGVTSLSEDEKFMVVGILKNVLNVI